MPKFGLVIVCLFFSILIFLLFPQTVLAQNVELEHIFIISVDGLNYEGFVSAPTPNLLQVAKDGVIDKKCLAVKAGSSEAAEASLLSATFPDEHLFSRSGDKLEVDLITAVFERRHLPYVIIDGSGGNLKPFASSEKRYVSIDASSADREVIRGALEYFDEHRPFFTYIYLDDCKKALLNLDEKGYYNKITAFDDCLGELVAELKKQDIYYTSLLIITSAASSSPSNLVPLVINGPMCKNDTKISGTMVLDIVPTICKLINEKNLFNAKGIPIYDLMLVEEGDLGYLFENWVKELKNGRLASWNKYYMLEGELAKSSEAIDSLKAEKADIFSFVVKQDETIAGLKTRMLLERILFVIIFILALSGYIVEYRWLKKKFLLFDK